MAMLLRLAASSAAFLLASFLLHLGGLISAGIAALVFLALSDLKHLLICLRTAPRDIRALLTLLYIKMRVNYFIRSGKSIPLLFEQTAQKFGDKAAFVGDDQTWSFRQLDLYSNSVGHYFLEKGYRRGDVVAIFAESQPAYVGLWLGLSKVGIVPALVNFNLRSDPLLHSFQAAHARAVLFSRALKDPLVELGSRLRPFELMCFDSNDVQLPLADNFERSLASCSRERPPVASPSAEPLNFADPTTMTGPLFFIFTSGTTGMPKAAIVTHVRYFFMAMNVNLFFKISSADSLFTTLPLYHTAGGILGTGQVLLAGASMVVRKKFSASRFWKDCAANRCTVVQYIGELCRYLLAQPPCSEETTHRVRLAFGNGLRPQIWSEFQQRFGVARIGEFYGATESNANLINPDNTVGAVGFLTRIAPFLYPVRLIKVDEATGEPLRDPRTGLCQFCEPGEPGELVGRIVRGDPLRAFDGYVNREATQRKIAENVFSKGDRAFLSGDILEMDKLGYVYFRDRTGDTFRWRGENVSTSEVEGVLSSLLHLADCVVYGVPVPGMEGRAGMAAITRENGFNESDILTRLVSDMPRHLPPYARPVFIRFVSAIESTGTFKMKKTDVLQRGFDPSRAGPDKLFFFDQRAGEYVPLTPALFADISAQRVRL